MQCWFYAELTLRLISDGTSTTIKLSTRPIIDDATMYYPLIKELGSVGCRMGAYLPQAIVGQIIIDNSPNSFGYERRFADILERYTIVDQLITIYAAQTTRDDLNVTADFAAVYKSRMASYTITPDAVTIQLDASVIGKRIVTKMIDTTTFPSAPAASIGKSLPIVFGSAVECAAVRVAADADTSPEYAYATTLSTVHPVSGVSAYYVKDIDGRRREAAIPASTSDPLFQKSCSGASAGVLTSAAYALTLTAPMSSYWVLTAGKVLFDGVSTPGTPTGKLEFKLVEGSVASTGPDESRVVASASANKSDYTSGYNGSADFYVEFSFNRPAVLRPGVSYHLIISGSDEVAYPSAIVLGSSGGSGLWIRPNGTTGLGWNLSGSSSGGTMEFYAAFFTDTKSSAGDTDGLGYASFEITQKAAATGQTACDLTTLDIMVAVNGLRDDSSGTLTGDVMGPVIVRPHQAILLLDREWNGSTWGSGRIDSAKFPATITAAVNSAHSQYRVIRGRTEGRTSLEQALEALCRNGACRIALCADGTLGIYWWGTTVASTNTLTDEDTRVLQIDQRGVETIVNRVTMYYDQRLENIDLTRGSADGQYRNYGGTIDYYNGGSAIMTLMTADSVSMFGTRPLADATFNFIGDAVSAEVIGERFPAVFAMPHRFATTESPFFKYSTVDVLSVITLLHPDMPAYLGTSSAPHLPYYSGADQTLTDVYYWKRAQPYRAQVEAREIIFDVESFPRIRLTTRLLESASDPT